MANYSINHAAREIVLSSTFRKAAAIPNTDAFNTLAKLAHALPNYTIVNKTNANAKKDNLNYAKMEEILKLKGTPAQQKAYIEKRKAKTNFLQVKKWFYDEFSDMKPKAKAKAAKVDFDKIFD